NPGKMGAGGRPAAQQCKFADCITRFGGIQRARTEHHEPARERQASDYRPSQMLRRDDAERPFQPLSRVVVNLPALLVRFRAIVSAKLNTEPPFLGPLAADCHMV